MALVVAWGEVLIIQCFLRECAEFNHGGTKVLHKGHGESSVPFVTSSFVCFVVNKVFK